MVTSMDVIQNVAIGLLIGQALVHRLWHKLKEWNDTQRDDNNPL